MTKEQRRRWRRVKRVLFTPFRWLLYVVEALFFYLMMALSFLLGPERGPRLGGFIARKLGPLLPVHRDGVARLSMAIPEIPKAEADEVIRRLWDNLGHTMGEYPHLHRFRPDAVPQRVEVVGAKQAQAAASDGAIFFSAHLANWEVMSVAVTNSGIKGGIIYRKVNNPFVDWFIYRMRRLASPAKFIPKGGDNSRRIIQHLKARQSVMMLTDQKMREGVAVDFFGRPALTPAGAALLAARYKAALIPVSIERLPQSHFRVTLHAPLEKAATGDRHADMMENLARMNRFLEEIIRQRPHEWLWLHRRWPKGTV